MLFVLLQTLAFLLLFVRFFLHFYLKLYIPYFLYSIYREREYRLRDSLKQQFVVFIFFL